jgi:hypothetical protein
MPTRYTSVRKTTKSTHGKLKSWHAHHVDFESAGTTVAYLIDAGVELYGAQLMATRKHESA